MPLDVSQLPTLNALLNTVGALLLTAGWFLVRSGRIRPHKICMLSVLGVSVLFMISYLTYHAQAGSVRFTGTGVVRTVYFAILISHTILAAVIVPLALWTIVRAFKGERTGVFDRHRRVARWTLPIWLYVSVTGVVIYWMLYLM